MSGVSYLFLVDGYVFSYFSRPRAFPRKCPWSFFGGGERPFGLVGGGKGAINWKHKCGIRRKRQKVAFPHKKNSRIRRKKKAKKEFLHFFAAASAVSTVEESGKSSVGRFGKKYSRKSKSFLNFCILRITLSICQRFGNVGIPTSRTRIFPKSHLAPGHDCSFPA